MLIEEIVERSILKFILRDICVDFIEIIQKNAAGLRRRP
jgi:hypothetical protein